MNSTFSNSQKTIPASVFRGWGVFYPEIKTGAFLFPFFLINLACTIRETKFDEVNNPG